MKLTEIFHETWYTLLKYTREEPLTILNQEILPNIKSYPKTEDIFNVYRKPVSHYKVVILGQDPYFKPNQAVGKAFAVPESVPIPPSLKIIKTELYNTRGISFDDDIDNLKWRTLDHWSEQGILLLNTALTVEAGKKGSHIEYWREFIIKTIKYLSYDKGLVWLLWGKEAQKFKTYIHNPMVVKGYDRQSIKYIPSDPILNYILESPHPASEAYKGGKAGFYGCDHFYYTNIILEKNNRNKIKY